MTVIEYYMNFTVILHLMDLDQIKNLSGSYQTHWILFLRKLPCERNSNGLVVTPITSLMLDMNSDSDLSCQ